MPEYCYVCTNCGAPHNVVKSMSESSDLERCPVCNGLMRRDFGGEGVHAAGDSYHTPLISDSLAMNPSQIAEHNQQFPDIKVHPDGRPQFDNFKQHNDYLAKTGFVKMPGKKRRGKKIKSA